MVNTVISPGTGNVNLSPLMFHAYAVQYLQCKRAFTAVESYSPVPYFLLCRAIELQLKAKHLELQSPVQVKRTYGHNIKKLYDDLPAGEKVLDATQQAVLESASKIYDVPNKGFEYVSVWDAITGLKDFPNLSVLEEIAEVLVGHGA